MENLELNHFKAFADKISWSDIQRKNILLYGENGAGKSSLFDALKYVFYKDEIEKVDALLPLLDQQAHVDAVRESYKNHQSVLPFSVKFNGTDLYSLDTSSYQVFMLRRFNQTNQITLRNVLSGSFLPENVETFMAENYSFVIKNVNEELARSFLEPIEISVADEHDGYLIAVRNTETGLSRSQDLKSSFNEAIINLIQLLIWFTTVQLMFDAAKRKIVVLDDFITSLDAANRALIMHFILANFSEEQLVIFTHDYSLFNITSYIIRYVESVESKWKRYKLYVTSQGHNLMQVMRIRVQCLQDEYNNPACDYEVLGNKIRKCFEQLLHDLSVELSIGTLEETKNIIDRIANNETVYWKSDSNLQELITRIEKIIPSISDTSVRNKLLNLIGQYKLKKANKLKDTICSLKLYQKITMHPLSHGILGVAHFSKKDVRQSLILLEQLEKCVYSIVDGKI